MEKFAELINNTAEPVLVDFYATWCGPCKMMHPILENVKARVGNKARIVKIDVDEQQALAMKYQIQAVPTLMLFKDGKVLGSIVAPASKAAIETFIQETLAQ